MEEVELINFIKVWLIAITVSCYSYSLTKLFHIPKGFKKLFLNLPIIYLFLTLPLSLSSFHLGGPTIFYLVWLGNFKIILYSFGIGPLSPTHPNNPLSLPHFTSILLLPIKVKPNPLISKSSSNQKTKTYPFQNTPNNGAPHDPIHKKRILIFCLKLVIFTLVVKLYDYKHILPSFIIYGNYFCHMYLGIEITLAASGALAQSILGLGLGLELGLAQQFNEPYLATSLQDFWGRRWNLMVSDILRLSVYNPILRVTSRLVRFKWARGVATLACFVVSGLMHELIYYHLTRADPTWEVTCFFVLHGVCTAVEVVAKEVVGGGFRLPTVVSRAATIVFLCVTGVWLFLPQLLRNGLHNKAINEYPIMFDFVKHIVLGLGFRNNV